ncbi:hypothetical protein [Breoghania sp.]|uniref:hypothetical protein n=1 Tax=Breoghania sp. TaxID=2065378 RepID=UPI002601AD1F|nr:hypothetical protein [Breoghania sp.]MDJ0929599.1 hypothetical protein [Breoghania sp.]
MKPSSPNDWYGWQAVGEGGLVPFTDLAASIDENGSMNVSAVDSQTEVSHAKQQVASGRLWTGYTHLGLTLAGLGAVAAGLDGNGNVALGSVNGDGVVWTTQERTALSARWSGWQPSAHAPRTLALTFQASAHGTLALFDLTPPDVEGGSVWMIGQAGLDSTEWSARTTTPFFRASRP